MKFVVSVVVALIINVGLFLLMDRMVSRETARLVYLIDTQPIEFLRTEIDEETRTRDRRTPPPPKPLAIQRPQAQVQSIATRVSSLPTAVAAYEVTSLLGEGGGIALGRTLMEGSVEEMDIVLAEDLIPLTMLPPQYPPSARMRRIQGWVEMLFTVNADGSVSDPMVLESEPEGIFDTAAMDAALRWRFRPVTVDGEPQDTLAQILINFSLEDDL